MSDYFYETVENARVHYSKMLPGCVGEKFDGSGFIAFIRTENRTYYVNTRIDSDADLVMMEIAPGIYCSPASRAMVGEYIAKINESFKSCTLHIEDNGTLYIKAEQRFDDAPISTASFRLLEVECIKILDVFETVLDKIANLRLITPEEADVEKVYDAHMKKIFNLIREKIEECDYDDTEIDSETEERLLAEIEELFDDVDNEACDAAPKEKKPRKNRILPKRKRSGAKDETLPEKVDFDSIVSIESEEDAN